MTPLGTSENGQDGISLRIVSDEHGVPFSKGLLAQSLTATGLSPDRAYRVAIEVEKQVRQTDSLDISIDELHALVGRVLATMEGPEVVARYRKWNQIGMAEKPVIVLIGGATGVGKSTIASQLANRLGIVRLISTDSIRQVMRTFFSPALMPAIHYSSFNAGAAIRVPVGRNLDPHLVAFVEQVEMVSVGVEAIIERAITEGTSLVVEGVHLVPGFLDPANFIQALHLHLTVSVSDTDLHMSHFLVRERETDGRRPFTRYVEHFDEIRRIQDFILERAAAEGTIVVDNVNIDDAVATAVDALYTMIEEGEQVSVATGGEA
ncbi:MAG: zeta toxin family protein [Actinobacteria bacterium]|nr:zeta toxin family protein [Actinomycetota bacterium]